MAFRNPHTIALLAAVDPSTQVLEQEVMLLFTSPIESYVSPSFYTHTKPKSGEVVPTWFFSAVQVYGTLKFHTSSTFLQSEVEDLTRHGEQHLIGFPANQAWKVSDAPQAWREGQMKRIIGIEIAVTRMEGKGKFGQEVAGGSDQMGCMRGFEALGTDGGKEMAKQIEASMGKNPLRVGALEEEKGRVQGSKVIGKFGWYFTAVEGEKETGHQGLFVGATYLVLCLVAGYLMGRM
jgi:transcriptional regulator